MKMKQKQQSMAKSIAIITVVKNRTSTIGDAFESLASQINLPTEYAVIDGESIDGTLDRVKQLFHGNRIKGWFVSEPDDGVYDAINKGIRMSTSDVIGLLHSDDVFAAPTTIGKVMEVFENDPTVDIVYGDLVIFDRDLQKPIRYWRTGQFVNGALEKGWMPPHPTLFLRRSVFERYGRYDISFQISADYDFILRIFKDGNLKAHYIPEVLVHMRSGGMSSKRYWSIIREDYRAIKKNNIGGFGTLMCKYGRSAAQLFRKYPFSNQITVDKLL